MSANSNISGNAENQSSGKLVTANRCFIGSSLAILLCPSSNGKVFAVTIDKEDLPRVMEYGPWSVSNFDSRGGVKLYCHSRRRHGKGMLYLHRLIMNAPDDRAIEVDHIHNRTLDTRKSEMRLCSKSLNQRNKAQSGPLNKFGLRGVLATRSGKFAARVWINHKSKILGTYDTPEQAGEVVRQFLIEAGAFHAAQAPPVTEDFMEQERRTR